MARPRTGSISHRCGCTDENAKQLSSRCPKLSDEHHGSYSFRISVKTFDGVKARPSQGGFRSKPEAVEAMNALMAANDRKIAGQTWTVERWLTYWIDLKQNTVIDSTMRIYEGHVRGYLIPHLGAIPLKRLRTADIQGMFRQVGANPGRYDPVLAGSTLQAVRATLQNALKDAIRRGLIEHNPAKNVRLPKKTAQPARIWTQQREEIYRQTGQRPRVAVWRRDHLVRFITSIQDDELFPLWLLAGMLGPRRGELAGLRLIDHDFEASEITMDHQSDYYKGRHVHHRTKTPKGERTLPLDQYTNQILANHVRSQLIRAQADGDTSGSMFTRNGKPLARSWITATFQKKVEALDLPPVRLHDLRHGSATNALASGSHIKLIQEKLGHADFRFSLETYVHVLSELAHQGQQQMADWLLGPAIRDGLIDSPAKATDDPDDGIAGVPARV